MCCAFAASTVAAEEQRVHVQRYSVIETRSAPPAASQAQAGGATTPPGAPPSLRRAARIRQASPGRGEHHKQDGRHTAGGGGAQRQAAAAKRQRIFRGTLIAVHTCAQPTPSVASRATSAACGRLRLPWTGGLGGLGGLPRLVCCPLRRSTCPLRARRAGPPPRGSTNRSFSNRSLNTTRREKLVARRSGGRLAQNRLSKNTRRQQNI